MVQGSWISLINHFQGSTLPPKTDHNPKPSIIGCSSWPCLRLATEHVSFCGSAALHEHPPRSEPTLEADLRPYRILGCRGQVALLEVVLASTSVAELAAISLRPSLADQAVVHYIAVPDVMVASASKAAPVSTHCSHRRWVWLSPRYRALSRLVTSGASRAGHVPACSRSRPIAPASIRRSPRRRRLLQRNFIRRRACAGRRPHRGGCPLPPPGGGLLLLFHRGGIRDKTWHIRI